MSAFRKYSDTTPFRTRSETPQIALELSLQPYHAFHPDAVIMFSDILTPLPALGLDFHMVPGKGPVIPAVIRTARDVARVTDAAFAPRARLAFVGEVLERLRERVHGECAVLGFVGAPFTLASYMIEGCGVKNLMEVKKFIYGDQTGDACASDLHVLLAYLEDVLVDYVVYQIDAGAQGVQLFDSWAHHLSPDLYNVFALPYAKNLMKRVKLLRPDVPLFFFANGSAGKIDGIAHELQGVADVLAIDWGVRMSDARHVWKGVLQGNVDPAILTVGTDAAIETAVRETAAMAGDGLILNLGHGVVKETPERAVKAFVDAAKSLATVHA